MWPIKALINKNFFGQNAYVAQTAFSEYLAVDGRTYYHFANFGKHYYEIDRQEVPENIYLAAINKIETASQHT